MQLISDKGGRYSIRIEKTETLNKTFRMPAELVSRLQEVAQEQDISMNNLVVQCCEYALNNLATTVK